MDTRRLRRTAALLRNGASCEESAADQLEAAADEIQALRAIQTERDILAAKLAELEGQEPKAWVQYDAAGRVISFLTEKARASWLQKGDTCIPLFAGPLPATPVRLTDAEIGLIEREAKASPAWDFSTHPLPLARAIETAVLRKLGIDDRSAGK